MACFFHVVVEPLHNDVILIVVSYGCCMDMPKTCGQFPSFHITPSASCWLFVPVGAGHGRWMDGWYVDGWMICGWMDGWYVGVVRPPDSSVLELGFQFGF